MALAPGTRIGIYEVTSLIGAGGMGEVYLARDTQLGRNVALKVLPDMFAADAERLARFRREAQVLAALHHPNIATIHGFEDGPAEAGHHVQALVLEYIEGDTLADRIAAGPIPTEEALTIGRQIAEALQAAHDQGVIHRDLKPSNVKLTPDGAVKVLDFGLAKLASPAESVAGGGSSVSLSPTITSPAATTLGVILGTAAYMAPEQAKGKPADRRSDVWAFGCVLFEMLARKRAFEGDDVSDTLASVLKGEPEWSALPADLPSSVRTLIRSCLTKDSRARPGDISTALFVLKHQDALIDRQKSAESVAPSPRRPSWGLVGAAVLAFIAVAAGSGWIGSRLQPEDPLRGLVTTFPITLPENESFSNPVRTLVAVSPDSRRIVFAAGNRLNVRHVGQLDAVPIRGTEGTGTASPRGPFFSPDGEWLAYWNATQLKRIAVNGGAATVLANVDARGALGAHWGQDDTIVFAQLNGIWRVSALTGGTPELLVKVDGNRRFQHPQLLPGGEALLYTATNERNLWDEADIVIRRLKDGSETRIAVGSDARYLPSGHIAFVVRGALMAMPFDLNTLTATGGQVALLEGVSANTQSGTGHFDVSSTGTLAYVTGFLGGTGGGIFRPVWVSREAREEPLGAEDRTYLYLRLSPDQTRVAFDVQGDNRDIYVWDVGQRAMRRLTTSPSPDRMPIFTRDSRRIIYSSDIDGFPNLFSQSADGVGGVQRLTQSQDAHFAMSTAPDDTVLVRVSAAGAGGTTADIHQLSLAGDRKLTKLIGDEFLEQNAEVSHGGQWIAYQTDRSGRNEILVRPYPANDAEFPVSTAGGTEPLWSADDSELFYRSLTGAIMRVRVKPGPTWIAGPPEQVLPGESYRLGVMGSPYRTYDVSRDGRRFLVLKEVATPGGSASAARIVVIENFFEELRRKAPAK